MLGLFSPLLGESLSPAVPKEEMGCHRALEKALFWVLPETFGTFYHFKHNETPILTPPNFIENNVNSWAVYSDLLG